MSNLMKYCMLIFSERAMHASAVVPLQCKDLPSNDTYDISFEGSWTYYRLDKKAPFSMGSIGFSTFSDKVPKGPLYPHPLSLHVATDTVYEFGDSGANSGCETNSYTWWPDRALAIGSCQGTAVSMEVAYRSNDTYCARYNVTASEDVTLYFEGSVPSLPEGMSAKVADFGQNYLTLEEHAYTGKEGTSRFFVDRWWLLQADVDASPNVTGDSYSFTVSLSASEQRSFSFCMTEHESPVANIPPMPGYDADLVRQNIDDWLAEANPPETVAADPVASRQYYLSWYQFWFNTEHDGGNWVRPALCPSMSYYARGVWLWDTGFHVFALLAGGGGSPRSLQKAQDQIIILTTAGLKAGHIPGSLGIMAGGGTQAPGILTWAALAVFNQTGDQTFLKTAYDALSMNNDWWYVSHPSGDDTGLCMWKGTESGWDTSPRWDQGLVKAIDLNAWLHMDHKLLQRMSQLLGAPQAEQQKWAQKAVASADAIQRHLWDNDAGIFWDQLPGNNSFVKVITPATFWSLLAGVANQKQANRMTDAVLTADRLGTKFPMPVVGINEPTFSANTYWRGPVWVNVNWLSALGLDCYGKTEQARLLREGVTKVVSMNPYPREYYNTFTGAGLGAKNFMWTGAVNIIVLNELNGGTKTAASILREAVPCAATAVV